VSLSKINVKDEWDDVVGRKKGGKKKELRKEQEASDPPITDTRFNNDKAAPVISGEQHFNGMSFLIRFESTPLECKAASDT